MMTCCLSQYNPDRASRKGNHRPGSNPGSEAKHRNMSSLLVNIVVAGTCLLPSNS